MASTKHQKWRRIALHVVALAGAFEVAHLRFGLGLKRILTPLRRYPVPGVVQNPKKSSMIQPRDETLLSNPPQSRL